MTAERDLLRKWAATREQQADLCERVHELWMETEQLLGVEPDPGPGPGPAPEPGDGILLEDQWVYSVEVEEPGEITEISLSLQFMPEGVHGLRGLGGITLDNSKWRLWANRSANGRIFIETATASSEKENRPFLKLLPGEWYSMTVGYEKDAAGIVSVDGPESGESALVQVTAPAKVKRFINFAFGSSLADEAAVPEHVPPVGWRIRKMVMSWRINGKLREVIL